MDDTTDPVDAVAQFLGTLLPPDAQRVAWDTFYRLPDTQRAALVAEFPTLARALLHLRNVFNGSAEHVDSALVAELVAACLRIRPTGPESLRLILNMARRTTLCLIVLDGALGAVLANAECATP